MKDHDGIVKHVKKNFRFLYSFSKFICYYFGTYKSQFVYVIEMTEGLKSWSDNNATGNRVGGLAGDAEVTKKGSYRRSSGDVKRRKKKSWMSLKQTWSQD